MNNINNNYNNISDQDIDEWYGIKEIEIKPQSPENTFKSFDWNQYNDTEQKILECWAVVDDMKLILNNSDIDSIKAYIQSLATVYQHKFDDLYNKFRE